MKEIFLTKTYPTEQLMGKFLDESHYDFLISSDCDVYKPLTGLERENGEHNLLLKFRKNVFSPALVQSAYDGLRDAAVESQNRGLAAGPRQGKLHGRDWVSTFHEEILKTLPGPIVSIQGEDLIENVYNKFKDKPLVVSSKGNVWLTSKRPADFNFDMWVEETKHLSKEKRIDAVEQLNEWISDTSYANPVYSGIAGYFDRYPRIPYCRTTMYSNTNHEKFDKAVGFIEAVSDQFKELVPGRWEEQNKAISTLDEKFRVGRSAYTTITVNRAYRTATHRDAGDFTEGFGNLSVTTNGVPYKGFNLIFPGFRVAVDVRPGDMLAMDVHEPHGNSPGGSLDPDREAERISIVCYMREKMGECGTKQYEDARFNFVESRRLNNEHPLWVQRWNGVSPNMWESKEWRDYLMNNGLHEEADKINIEEDSNNLQRFLNE